MERLMIATTFQKSIDVLKTTECSQKEKLALFTQIADCIQSSALRSNANYLNCLSSAVTILLMFCEEMDSVTRMSAEENLNKIIRFATPTHIVRIQYDLFHEIKRNGNERSLRISLNLFGYYCHLIKQRKIKPYALNLLPCILAISGRKEQQLLETLSCFLQQFCKYLQISLNENEVVNVIEIFVSDAITTDCSVKRRCSASNVVLFIEHSKRPEVMAKHALTTCLDILVRDFISNNIIGALGLLRVLLPTVMAANVLELIVIHKIIEIYEICLHLLHDDHHTVINASLECLCILLNQPKPKLRPYLISSKLKHIEALCRRRSLKNQIFKRKSSTASMEQKKSGIVSKNQLLSPSSVKCVKNITKISGDAANSQSDSIQIHDDERNVTDGMLDASNLHTLNDDKYLLTCSDIELESFKTNDFESDKNYDSSAMQSPAKAVPGKKSLTDTVSLTRQKSTDSIGSFFNTILTHSNTESVSKFFRVGSYSQHATGSLVPQTPKSVRNINEDNDDKNQADADSISVVSLSSQVSLNSQNSLPLGTFDVIPQMNESLPEIEILTDQEIAAIKLESNTNEMEIQITEQSQVATTQQYDLSANRQIYIGSISDQPLVHYTVRLIASKFLLPGTPHTVFDEIGVRVSIKNLALVVISHCVALCPMTLLLSLQKTGQFNDDEVRESNHSTEDSEDSTSFNLDNIAQPEEVKTQDDQLNIKDDHFGENSKIASTYFDFLFPLSKSADNVLLSRLNKTEEQRENAKCNQKLNTNLTELLSKSDIVESGRTLHYFGDDGATSSRLTSIQPPVDSTIQVEICDNQFASGFGYFSKDSMFADFYDTQQLIEDILLFWNHTDPILRANTQLLVGNFLSTVLNECESVFDFLQQSKDAQMTYKFLNVNILMHIILKGLTDDIHVVVKQSLNSLEKILSILFDHRQQWFRSIDNSMKAPDDHAKHILSMSFADIIHPRLLLETIFEELLLVSENKYWVIQNRYCQFVATMNFQTIKKIIGRDKSDDYKNRFMVHIYTMLRDADQRVRTAAAKALCDFNQLQCKRLKNGSLSVSHTDHSDALVNEFLSERAFNDLPYPLCDLNKSGIAQDAQVLRQIKRNMGKCLFNLSNMLLDIECKEQQFGAIKCMLKLMDAFNPINYSDIWMEFSLLEVSLALLSSNYATGTDLSCQCDLILFCTNLLAAELATLSETKKCVAEQKTKNICSALLSHILKLLNIYHHILTNQRPIFIPKGQKADIFVNSKELQMINSYGYFGNDYFYLKIYKSIKILHESYKITITDEIDSKLFALLKTCLRSLIVLLEINDQMPTIDSIRFSEEILSYLKTFLSYVPKKCVISIKQLLKYMFSMNFSSRKTNYKLFNRKEQNKTSVDAIFENIERFKECDVRRASVENETETVANTSGIKLMTFLGTSTLTPEKKSANSSYARNIKIFEPIVIQCLKLFTKSDSLVQSIILNMLCHVLELRISYCLLDSKNIFLEFILKLLESIEIGSVRNSHVLTPNIIQFLFQLSKQTEKPLMTIPKIINITDTLLANSVTKNGCIEALSELAYEIYFQQNFVINYTSGNEMPTNVKELNTQKEVVFSMLLKFIASPMTKKMICLILLKEKENLNEIKAELTETLLHILDEDKIMLNDADDYYYLRQLFGAISTNVNAEKTNFYRILAHFLRCRKTNQYDDIGIKTLILENIIDAIDETAMLDGINKMIESNSIEGRSPPSARDLAKYLADHIRSEINRIFSENIADQDPLTENELARIVDQLDVFQEFFTTLTKIAPTWKQTMSVFKEDIASNAKLIGTALGFVHRLLTVMIPSTIPTREFLCVKKGRFLTALFTFVLEVCDKSLLIDGILKNGGNMNNSIDRCTKVNLLTLLLRQPLSSTEIDFLLENYFDVLMCIDTRFIINLSALDECFECVLRKLCELIEADGSSSQAIVEALLDVVENSSEASFSSSLECLLKNIVVKVEHSSALLRRSFTILRKKLTSLSCKDGNPQMELYENNVTESFIVLIEEFKRKYQDREIYSIVSESVESILQSREDSDDGHISLLSNSGSIDTVANENWFLAQAENVIRCKIDKHCVFQILSEIKSESKLRKMFDSIEFDKRLLPTLIQCSFENMTAKFRHDCFQHNPHMNYLKIPLVLKQAMAMLGTDIKNMHSTIFKNPDNTIDNSEMKQSQNADAYIAPNVIEIMTSLHTFLRCIERLEMDCLAFVEAQFIRKFFGDNFLRSINEEQLNQFAHVCLLFIKNGGSAVNSSDTYVCVHEIVIACDCLNAILNHRNASSDIGNDLGKDQHFVKALLGLVHQLVSSSLVSKSFLSKHSLEKIIEQQSRTNRENIQTETLYAKAIFLGKFIECCFSSDGSSNDLTDNTYYLVALKNTLMSMTISIMRSDFFYFFAVTPLEIVSAFDWSLNAESQSRNNRLPSIPIDFFNDAEVVEKFIKRIDIFGFPSRQYFEELFMSLLLLINKENDFNIVDAQELYQIQNICLTAIIELLLSCKMFTAVGNRTKGMFHHNPRLQRPKADSISVKKLHKIQTMFLREPTVFYMPNLERCLSGGGIDADGTFFDNAIGTTDFLPSQYELNIVWHIIEEQPFLSRIFNVELKNMRYFVEKSAIDLKSSIQVVFDVITQLVEGKENYAQLLPHIIKFCEICENREQFRWIKNTMVKLQESIHMENAVCHEHIIYCLCKSYAILVPSLNDLNHLCALLSVYLKSSHLFVRTAALKGLLTLFESCVKTNTTIGGLSEEILMLRTFIISYITKYGIIEESPLAFSTEHTILVWTLNFYVIETTSKFVPECNLLANTVISANNILKRTTNLQQYLCILYGMERLIISKSTTKFIEEKIERLALDLVKLDNEQFSLAALKLLVTCMYIGSNEQLENTERCNGIVQDEPEIIVQSTEKIDILFNRIKLSSSSAAHIYGDVLCQLTHDLVPPKEVLTKVIKELLTISQPHCVVIAKILFQVFRSAIDSSYLLLLQDWLLCSLPNFLSFPIQKTIWCLTIIFISSSINLDLIKIFPKILADHNAVTDAAAIDKSKNDSATFTSDQTEENNGSNTAVTVPTHQTLFALACKDFYQHLNNDQRYVFRDIFSSMEEPEIQIMLTNL